MKKVCMEIQSKNTPYKFEGTGELKKDLLFFKDNNYKYIFDIKTNKLIKEKKDEKMTIDFLNERIHIDSDGIELDFKITLLFEKIEENLFNFQYKLDKEIIEFLLEIKEEENE